MSNPNESNSSHQRPWFRPQLSLGTLLWLMLLVGMSVAWWRDRQQLDQRLRKLEQASNPSPQVLWSAQDILGPPDDPTGMAGKSWCPAGSNSTDWVEVSYDSPVPATTIDIHECYSVGCVTKVEVTDGQGREVTIWQGTDPTPSTPRTGLFPVPVPKSVTSIQSVKIHVDSVGKPPWPCIDAVGLTTASKNSAGKPSAGKTTWATSAACSSVYGNSPLTATRPPKKWLGIW